MPNTFTTVSHQGFGSRIMGAIIGVPVGIVLIFGSCILLYWNEGRTDYCQAGPGHRIAAFRHRPL